MSKVITGIILLVALSACALFESYTPQEELGYKLINTVKTNNFSGFKKLFSKDLIQKKFKDNSNEAMEKVFNTYKEKFNERYKAFEAGNFHFNYQGSEREGELYIFFNEKRNAKKPIIFENGNWVFNEL